MIAKENINTLLIGLQRISKEMTLVNHSAGLGTR
jgi:hypothetical protein